jgi:endonuclease III
VADGTISQAYAVLASLIRGAVHDRHTIAKAFGITVASADRYIRAATQVPGVRVDKHGKRLTLRWSFTDAIKEAGL